MECMESVTIVGAIIGGIIGLTLLILIIFTIIYCIKIICNFQSSINIYRTGRTQ